MTTVLAKREQPDGDPRLMLHSDTKRRSVALGPVKGKRWQPPEGLTPADVQTVIDAAAVRLRRVIEHEWFLALAGGASVLFAILLMVWPGAGVLAAVWLIGGYALVFGILLMSLAFRWRGSR